MRSFLFTLDERPVPCDGSGVVRKVRIYRIMKNRPEFLCEESGTYQDAWQLVMQGLQRKRALPAEAFTRTSTGARRYPSAYALEADGIAVVTQV